MRSQTGYGQTRWFGSDISPLILPLSRHFLRYIQPSQIIVHSRAWEECFSLRKSVISARLMGIPTCFCDKMGRWLKALAQRIRMRGWGSVSIIVSIYGPGTFPPHLHQSSWRLPLELADTKPGWHSTVPDSKTSPCCFERSALLSEML